MKTWIDRSDAVLGLRLAWKHRLLTLTVVAALAVGIALATGAFTFTDAVLHGRLPFEHGERFVRLEAFSQPEGRRVPVESERFRLVREGAASLEYLGVMAAGPVNLLLDSGEVVSVLGARVTPGLLAHAAFPPVAGRTLVAADGCAGAEAVVVVRESLWERRFGRDPALLGSVLDVGGERRTVVGIAPDTFRFPSSGEIWTPLAEDVVAWRAEELPGTAVGIVRAGRSLAEAADEVRFLSARFDAGRAADEAARVELVGFTDLSSLGVDQLLAAAVGMTVLVLFVIAANVANLIYARTAARSAELAMRSALGASRGRLVAQLFTEVALMAVAASALGLLVSQRALELFRRGIDADELPFWLDFSPRASTFGFVVAAALVASLVAGVLPALKATRRDFAAELRAESGRGGGLGFGRIGGTMMVVEMALSVALVSGAVSLARGVARYGELEVDLPDREVLTAQISLDAVTVADPRAAGAESAGATTRERLLAAVRDIPGVVGAGAATSLPRMSPGARSVSLAPADGAGDPEAVRAPVVGVSEGFLESLDGEALAGRLFGALDFAPGAAPVALVNSRFVDRFYQGRNPVGRRLRVDESGEGESAAADWREIVGVVPDLGIVVGDPQLAAGLYVPVAEEELLYLAARTEGDPLRLAEPLRRAIYAVDPALVVRRVDRLDAVNLDDRVALRVFSAVLVGIGLAALVLALVGMYAIVSFTITRRTREIGIRIALGAAPRQILGSVFGRAAALLAIGGLVGSALAALLVGLRASIFASTLPDAGPWVFPTVLLLLAAVGVLACLAPARRALAVDPSRALSQE